MRILCSMGSENSNLLLPYLNVIASNEYIYLEGNCSRETMDTIQRIEFVSNVDSHRIRCSMGSEGILD
jgi:hypothetical protein